MSIVGTEKEEAIAILGMILILDVEWCEILATSNGESPDYEREVGHRRMKARRK